MIMHRNGEIAGMAKVMNSKNSSGDEKQQQWRKKN